MSVKHLVRILGLALVAAFALSAVAAAGASASVFKTAGGFPVTFEGSGGAGSLTTTNHKIECTSSESKGKATSATEAKEILVTYKVCKEPLTSALCGSNGEIKTVKIVAEPVDLGGAGTAPVGLKLKPETGTEFAKFNCGLPLPVVVSGEVLCESKGASVGKEATTGELVCKQKSVGVQEYEKANGGSGTIKLESEFAGVKEKAAINTTESLVFSKAIEQTTP